MVERNQELLADKLKKPLFPLPIEFNRQKEMMKTLSQLKQKEREKGHQLMKEILEQKNRGEDFEANYLLLLETRRQYDIFDQEEKDTIAK